MLVSVHEMKVLLVDPPKPQWRLLGNAVMPPIGFASLASVLRENDIEVKILDCSATQASWKELRRRIESEHPDILGSGCATCHYEEAKRVFKIAKQGDSEIITVAGGPHFSLATNYCLDECMDVDYVVVGEGEFTLLEFCKETEKRSPNFKRIKGLAFRTQAGPRITEPRPLIQDLDELPFPAWDLLPMDKYHIPVWGNKLTMLLTSRGCPFNCSFCSERVFWGGIWRGRSAEKIVEEMEIINSKFRKEFVWFADDTFNLDRKRNEDFCNELIERDLDMEWSFEGRTDLILRDRDLLGKMVKSGLFWILIGVEFSSKSELEAYGKALKPEDIEQTFKELKRYDLVTQAMFIVGTPKDTKESIKEKLDFAKKLEPFFVIFSPLTPLPGTEVYNEAKESHRIEVQDFSKYDFAHAIMRTETLSREEVDALILDCYKQFYGVSRLRHLFSLNKHKRGITRYLLGLMFKERIKNWFSWPKEYCRMNEETNC